MSEVELSADQVVQWVPGFGPMYHAPMVPMIHHKVQAGISSQLAAIGRGTPVPGPEGEIGTVDHLLVDREGEEIRHLVVDRGSGTQYRILPISRVAEVTEAAVATDVTEEELEQFPVYEA